jgi:hypothetical protein
MPPFTFRWPNTAYRVQGYTAEEVSGDNQYEAVFCAMCQQIHLVNPATGKVLGEEDD